jgi:superoxide dismutase
MDAIKRDFGSFENMKTQLSASTVAVQGSGWGWLGFNKQSKRLQIAACPNQDPLEATTGKAIIFYLLYYSLPQYIFVLIINYCTQILESTYFFFERICH